MTAPVTVAAPPAAGTPRPSGRVLSQVRILTERSLRALVLDPRLAIASSLTPLIMLVVFSQVFATMSTSAHFPRTGSYVDFLMPALMVTTALQTALATGYGLTQEMHNGIVSRFRSLPVWPGAILIARSLADVIRSGLQLLVLVVAALAVFGFRPPGGPWGVVAAGLVALLVGSGLGWVLIALACWIRNAELMQSVAGLMTFPLMFASNAFVPVAGLPDWLQVVARLNPVTYGIEAARSLVQGEPARQSASLAVALSIAIAVVALPVAIRGFNRRV